MKISAIAVRIAAATSILALASCAQKTQHVEAPPAPEKIPARPTPPHGAYGNISIPPRAADGRYITINHNLSTNQSIWHLRSALNVAALGCRGSSEQTMVSHYNQFLHRHEKTLASVHRSERQAHNKKDGQRAFDAYMTKLYNFFAQPAPQSGFCTTAAGIIQQAAALAPADLSGFAPAALANLEAPFTDFYQRYEQYQANLAAWESRYGSRAIAAAATPTTAASSAPVAATSSAALATWRVQLGAFSDTASANDAWQKVRGKVSALGKLNASYEPVPNKPMVRLQAGPLSDKKTADSLCATIAATGQGCIPVAPSL